MSKTLITNNSAEKPIKISEKTRELYEQRNKELDHDPDCPTLPLEKWAKAKRGVFLKSVKKPVTLRIDADVLAWLQASGAGYQKRLNQILRTQMEAERRGSQS